MAKILLVDDSETVRNQLQRAFIAKNHDIIEAENGIEGLEILAANKDTDIIISDVNMPQMDGITMCGRIHEQEIYEHIHLFILTTEFDPELKIKGKSAGVKLWATKPVNTQKLLTIVEKVLSK